MKTHRICILVDVAFLFKILLCSHFYVADTSNKCELKCQPIGETFWYKLADKVQDGTPCELTSNDVCINGECRVRNVYIHEIDVNVVNFIKIVDLHWLQEVN